ncbi:MAG TPA: hypothetical protein VJ927_11785 [Actinomycetota bacterium]|nr:hypothetical protein [Actinomycetota bacterium]
MAIRPIPGRCAVWLAAAVVVSMSACGPGLFGRTETVNTGEITSLTGDEVCITHELPDGPAEKCWRIEDDTRTGAAIDRGDLVEVRFEGDVASEVRPIPPH